jgi:outer membrane beta-barrel protein
MFKPSTALTGILFFVKVLIGSDVAIAQDAFQEQMRIWDRDDIHSIHKKLYTKQGRHELGLQLGGILNGGGYGLVTGLYQYHFLENMAVEAGLGGFGFQMGDNNRIAFYQASVSFSPLYGKVSLFTWAVSNFDIYFIGGGGVTSYSGLVDGSSFMANIGGGYRFFLNEFLSSRVEFRDYVYRRNNPSGSTRQSEIAHNFTLTAGLSMMFPLRQPY